MRDSTERPVEKVQTIVKEKNLESKVKVWVDFLAVERIDIYWIYPAYHYLNRSADIDSPRMAIYSCMFRNQS